MKISRIYDKPSIDVEDLKSILIIGDSEYGFTNEITEIANEEELINFYGINSSIYESYQAIKDEVIDTNVLIYVLKPYGVHSTASFNINADDYVYENSLIFKSIFSNSLYNDVKVNITKLGVTFEFPSRLNLKPITYLYTDFTNISSFVNKINDDTNKGLNVVIANIVRGEYLSFDESFYYVNTSKSLENGDSEKNLTNIEKYNRLAVSYDIIKGLEVDYICLTDVYLSDYVDETRSFYKQLFTLCIDQLQFGIVTLGIMTYYNENITNEGSFDEYISEIMSTIELEYNFELLKFLMVVIFDKLCYGYYKKLINSSAYIAFMLCKNKSVHNITSSPMGNNFSLNTALCIDNVEKLKNIGVINFRYSVYHQSVVITNGITNYTLDNTYKYLTSINMIQNILPGIKEILESNLGESILVLSNKKTIDTKMSEYLTKKSKLNIIDSYNFEIAYDLNNGSITYELELKNVYMVEAIKYIGKINS